jgi:flagellar biosynthesis chaperone FliJ
MNERLAKQHCQVQMGNKIIDKRLTKIQNQRDKQEQKVLDELSIIRFFHRRS